MRVFVLALGIALVGAAPLCGAPAASSGGTYGPVAPGPLPQETVTTDGKLITVSQSLGDRMFTTITAMYDAKTLALLGAKQHGSCCGSWWDSTVRRNADGSYDIEAQTLSGLHPNDIHKESRPHFTPRNAMPVVLGGPYFLPWLYYATRANLMIAITFYPLGVREVRLTPVSGEPYPDGVPHSDKALLEDTGSTTPVTLWYDPCTFRLDAYGERNGFVMLATKFVY